MKHSPRPTGTPSAILAPIHRDMAPQLMARLKRLAVLTAILLLASGAWAASKYRVLYSFQGGSDGADPYGGLTFDAAGNLYGATYAGGNQNTLCNTYGETGCGTIFKLSPGTGAWTKSLLYAFCSQTNCDDGDSPNGGLVLDAAGALYGTTVYGGGCSGYFYGCGAAFELAPDSKGQWQYSVLYAFQGNNDTVNPNGGLVFDQGGNLYGTGGGFARGCPCGTVFVLAPGSGKWTEHVLHSFCLGDCRDGADPVTALVWGPGGDLYGATNYGGHSSWGCNAGCGVLFKLTDNSNGKWKENVLRTLAGADGANPLSALISDSQGNLYGTTVSDGAFGDGTVFRLSPTPKGGWKYTVLHEFQTGRLGGGLFRSALVLDAKGNLYGTTWTGGTGNCNGNGCGLVYKLSPGAHDIWKYTNLYDFTGGSDGGYPTSPLIIDNRGSLYGETQIGGDNENGVVYEVTP